MPPVAALVTILLLSGIAVLRDWPAAVDALLDEPAHLLTAWLLWVALVHGVTAARMLRWVLVGAVAIDLDHLPLLFGAPQHLGPVPFLVHGGRPPTHSLLTVGTLLLLALVTARARVFVGLAAGVILHLVRDLATGPGVPLWWPFRSIPVSLPFAVYAGILVTATAVVVVRRADVVRRKGPSPVEARSHELPAPGDGCTEPLPSGGPDRPGPPPGWWSTTMGASRTAAPTLWRLVGRIMPMELPGRRRSSRGDQHLRQRSADR